MAMAAGGLLGALAYQNIERYRLRQNGSLQYKVDEAMHLIKTEYADVIDEDSLADEMLNAMLLTLDPHSRYVSAKGMETEMEQLMGQFEGVGMTLRRLQDTTCVNSVFPDGPAKKGGLLPGDRIVSVDTVNVCGPQLQASDVVSLIRGRSGTVVDLGVVRRGVEGVGHYRLRRSKVSTPSMNYSAMLDGRRGYIKISNFSDNTASEFHNALEDLKSQGMQELILDLRGNGGGLLDAAVKVCSDLLPKNDVIVVTKGAHTWRQVIKSPGGGAYTEGGLIVMIDESSASASEIVSGAIQDNDRGTIMGRRSFGKGLVQRQFMLHDGSAIMLTVSKYHTPSGRCIQRPYDQGVEAYYLSNYAQIMKDYLSDSIAAALTDTVPYKTKNGRTVYGGGGIVPDKVIPLKEHDYMPYVNQLSHKLVDLRYADHLVSGHVEELLKRYPDIESFFKGYVVTDAMLGQMADMGEKEGVARNNESLIQGSKLLKGLIKTYVAQSLYGDQGFYRCYIPLDEDLEEVLRH